MEHAGYKANHDFTDRLGFLLIRCGQKLGSNQTNQTQGRILKLLYLFGPLTQKALQDKLAIQPGSMSEIAAKLERKGLLLRQKNPDDKRKVLLTLTEAGRADVENFQAHHKSTHGQRFNALTPAEQESLRTMLEKLLDSWDAQMAQE